MTTWHQVNDAIKSKLDPDEQREAVLALFGKEPGDPLGPKQREMVNEVDRRQAMARRREQRKERKRQAGRKGDAYRRIIVTKEVPAKGSPLRPLAEEMGMVRDFQFHATKGWRSYAQVR